jgi:hypothetical protein
MKWGVIAKKLMEDYFFRAPKRNWERAELKSLVAGLGFEPRTFGL